MDKRAKDKLEETMNLAEYIRDIPDFPRKGILFRDITTLINNKKAFAAAIESLALPFNKAKIDYVAAIESRGFIFGGALAEKLKCGFVPLRKPGKLPAKTYKCEYDLEYGKDALEIHRDAFPKGARVLIFDDLLATGGTALAAANLIKRLKGKIVSMLFLVELTELNGRGKFKKHTVYSLIKY